VEAWRCTPRKALIFRENVLRDDAGRPNFTHCKPGRTKKELPGILNWALQGCRDWQEYGLAEPEEVAEATSEYQAGQDTVQGFLEDCCTVQTDAKVRANVLLEAYHRWSGDTVMSRQAFGDRLRDKGFRSERSTGGGYFWGRIALTNPPPGKVYKSQGSEHE
jgi:putative DNA primase/helicase